MHPFVEGRPVVQRATTESGGPSVPAGRTGREATRSFSIRDQFHRDRHIGAICESKDFGPIEPERCRFLSLRDPADATHAAGPPDVVSAHPELTDAAGIGRPTPRITSGTTGKVSPIRSAFLLAQFDKAGQENLVLWSACAIRGFPSRVHVLRFPRQLLN